MNLYTVQVPGSLEDVEINTEWYVVAPDPEAAATTHIECVSSYPDMVDTGHMDDVGNLSVSLVGKDASGPARCIEPDGDEVITRRMMPYDTVMVSIADNPAWIRHWEDQDIQPE